MVLGDNHGDERNPANHVDQHGLRRASYCNADGFKRQPAGRRAGDVRSSHLGSQWNLRRRRDYGYGNDQCFRHSDVAHLHGQRYERKLFGDRIRTQGGYPRDLLAHESLISITCQAPLR